MKLHILFHHYDDDPRLMPNAVAIMDEYTIDEIGYGEWVEAQEKAKGSYGPGSFRQAIVKVPDADVEALFRTTEITGEIIT